MDSSPPSRSKRLIVSPSLPRLNQLKLLRGRLPEFVDCAIGELAEEAEEVGDDAKIEAGSKSSKDPTPLLRDLGPVLPIPPSVDVAMASVIGAKDPEFDPGLPTENSRLGPLDSRLIASH